jgi:uncharacterized protein YxeA
MKIHLLKLLFLSLFYVKGQVYTFQSKENGKTINHRILIDKSYLVETQFVNDPPQFILTRGGFYKKKGKVLSVNFEFNSNFEDDGFKKLEMNWSKDWEKVSKKPKDLNGKWLMAGRVTDQGERRRDTSRPRKTMKFLLNGYFNGQHLIQKHSNFLDQVGDTILQKTANTSNIFNIFQETIIVLELSYLLITL